MTRLAAAFTGLFLLAVAGCAAGNYHIETVIHPDGSISRSILQPTDHLPETARQPAHWDQITWTKKPELESIEHRIDELPIVEPGDGRPYFAAWKRVDAVDELPEHYLKPGPDPEVASRLERVFERRDLGFIVEYVWQETLTDVVRLEEMRVARQELIRTLLNLAEFALSEGLGDDYDASPLVAWLRTDGTRWVTELTDALHDAALQSRGRNVSARLWPRAIEISRKYGLTDFAERRDDEMKLNDEKLLQFASQLVQRTVKRRDGKPLTDAGTSQILSGLLSDSVNETEAPLAARLIAAREQGISNYPGGKDAFNLKVEQLVARIWGVHCIFASGGADKFQFVLDIPGLIVETDGVLLSDSRVRWRFGSGDAYPAGYSMRGRSLEDRTDRLRGQAAAPTIGSPTIGSLTSRRKLLDVFEILDIDDELAAVALQCRDAGSLAPLEACYRERVANGESADVIALTASLLKLVSPPKPVP